MCVSESVCGFQNPPSLPALPLCYFYTLLHPSTKLVLDWHNYDHIVTGLGPILRSSISAEKFYTQIFVELLPVKFHQKITDKNLCEKHGHIHPLLMAPKSKYINIILKRLTFDPFEVLSANFGRTRFLNSAPEPGPEASGGHGHPLDRGLGRPQDQVRLLRQQGHEEGPGGPAGRARHSSLRPTVERL
jgi:hypothetical protein